MYGREALRPVEAEEGEPDISEVITKISPNANVCMYYIKHLENDAGPLIGEYFGTE